MSMTSEEEFKYSLQQDFLTEARELLEEFETIILESESERSEVDVNKLFRIMHTIKGSSFTADLPDLGDFAHKIEAVLDRVRDGSIDYTENVASCMLRACDVSRDFVEALISGDDLPDTTESRDELESIFGGQISKKPKKPVLQTEAMGFFDDEPDDVAPQPAAPPVLSQLSFASEFTAQVIDPGPPKILICDDEKDMRKTIEVILEPEMECTQAENGEKALELIKSNNFDTAIVDIEMPVMGGVDMLRELKKLEIKIPVIIITGSATHKILAELINLGASGFVSKPFTNESLASKVKNRVKMFRVHKITESIAQEVFESYIDLQKILTMADKGTRIPEDLREKVDKSMETIRGLTRLSLNQ